MKLETFNCSEYTTDYYLWADGDWFPCDEGELSWKSDDYVIVEIPDSYEGCHEDYLAGMHMEINLGQMCERKTIV